MKNVLIVTSINLYKNSSVTMANIAYINGFIANGYSVTVIMPDCGEADKDYSMNIPDIRIFSYADRSPIEARLSNSVKTTITAKETLLIKLKKKLHSFLGAIKRRILKSKKDVFSYYRYYLNQVMNHIDDFVDIDYEIIISLSTPVVSHYLAEKIINSKKINFSHWCQLWEDPWYYDLYVKKEPYILAEEKRLLDIAEKIIYVSPLTYKYQKEYFPEYASKMSWAFLPCYKEIKYNKPLSNGKIKLGYFGEFFSFARNILPLVEAIDDSSDFELVICGNSDVNISKFRNVQSFGRVELSKVEELQESSDILVNISNLRGGQIPGKVYQYAGTDKHVLFILDGSQTEKEELVNSFSSYNRFIFCDNDKESISDSLKSFIFNSKSVSNCPVKDFSPEDVVKKIISIINN